MPINTISPRLKAILQAVFVTVLWSSSWVLIKVGLHHSLPAITFAGIRYSLAFLCLAPFVLFNRRNRHEIKQLSRKDWIKLLLLGFVFYSLAQSAMFLSLQYLPANMVSLLLNLTSIIVGIAGIFLLKERPSLLQWAGIGIVAAGVGIYFFPILLTQTQIIGVGIGVFCMLMNAGSSIFSREVNRGAKYTPLIITFVSMGFGSLLMLVTGLAIQGIGKINGTDWLIIVWMAVANTAFAFWLWNRSLQVLTAVESSILNSLMMPQIAILAYIFLEEGMGTKDIIGLILVGIGTIIAQLKSSKNM